MKRGFGGNFCSAKQAGLSIKPLTINKMKEIQGLKAQEGPIKGIRASIRGAIKDKRLGCFHSKPEKLPAICRVTFQIISDAYPFDN
jgi:hypothetical protein